VDLARQKKMEKRNKEKERKQERKRQRVRIWFGTRKEKKEPKKRSSVLFSLFFCQPKSSGVL
jgi:hypothetical protein